MHFENSCFNFEMNVTGKDFHLYSITYKNALKKGKNVEDFHEWLKTFWRIQKSWGAESVHFWPEQEGDQVLVFCRYLVHDIRLWNRNALKHEASELVKGLERIAETSRITVDNIISPREGYPYHQ